MNLTLRLKLSVVIIMLVNGCSAYSTEDYGNADDSNKPSLCANMEPAQEMKCKENEESLIIGLGADHNCNHPYEYERIKCQRDQAKQQKVLDESLKKHTNN